MRLATRIAVNRTIAGVHFPIDSAAGAVLGLTLGLYFVARCQAQVIFRRSPQRTTPTSSTAPRSPPGARRR